MIDYLQGPVAEIAPTYAVIDCGGVGYEVNISLMDFTALQNEERAKLYIHEAIREDAHILFGFRTRRGREIFRLLIGVSGVGPGTARVIMSSLTERDIENAIAMEQPSMFKAVKGIGAKTAERIIVDLKDKIKVDGSALFTQAPASSPIQEEALAALLMLGFAKPQSEKVLRKIFVEHPDITVEDAIKAALKMM